MEKTVTKQQKVGFRNMAHFNYEGAATLVRPTFVLPSNVCQLILFQVLFNFLTNLHNPQLNYIKNYTVLGPGLMLYNILRP
jgi:hypothetical protein